MRALVDLVKGKYVRCLLENGDSITIHQSFLPAETKTGDILHLAFSINNAATEKQREYYES